MTNEAMPCIARPLRAQDCHSMIGDHGQAFLLCGGSSNSVTFCSASITSPRQSALPRTARMDMLTHLRSSTLLESDSLSILSCQFDLEVHSL